MVVVVVAVVVDASQDEVVDDRIASNETIRIQSMFVTKTDPSFSLILSPF